METLTEIAIKIFIEAILISGILGYFFSKREERMKKIIEEEFSKRDKFFDVRFNFKTEIKHVFTYNFPHDAEKAFTEKYEAYRNELKIESSLN